MMEEVSNFIPSGAHKQPWVFCAVGDPEIKSKIRKAAEEEEYTNYHGRMTVVFKKTYDWDEKGNKVKNYYVNESVGLASGFLLTAIHNVGLVALTHTPSPMNFLQKILERPENEKPFLLIPVGYPSEDATVPKLERKILSDIAKFY